jgi:ribosomal-protein-alanine N-acetyltransferase
MENTTARIRETPMLETDRLFLRKFRLEDVNDVFEYCKDSEVARFVTWDAHQTIENSLSFLKFIIGKYDSGEPSDWAITLKESGKVIGSIGIVRHDTKSRYCEMGYVLAVPFWGKGLMTEALQRICRFLFDECSMNRIEAECCIENPSSAKVMEKCGFVFEGVLREKIWIKDRFWNLKMYSLLRTDWLKDHFQAVDLKDRIIFEEATIEDLEAILELQKRAYTSEGQKYGNSIAPLTQTLEQIQSSFNDLMFIKVVLNDRIVASARIRVTEGTCHIGRLIVEPELQGRGIGKKMLATIESLYPNMRYELFTTHRTDKYTELYEKCGFKPFKTVKIRDQETLIYLEKESRHILKDA